MSAAERAEARRKAILSRGSDRLAKLTSSARGEDDEVYKATIEKAKKINAEDPPLASFPQTRVDNFIGEETSIPSLPTTNEGGPRKRNTPGQASTATDSATAGMRPEDLMSMSMEQQQQFLREFMSGMPLNNSPFSGPTFPQIGTSNPLDGSSEDDPMAVLMSSMSKFPPGAQDSGPFPGMATMQQAPPTPRTLLQKLMPLLHLIATWCLLAYFVLYKEPATYATEDHGLKPTSIFQRWAELGWRRQESGVGVQMVPFFWAFVTMQLVIHSITLFTKSDPVQPPFLVQMVLPHLPPSFRTMIMNALHYVKMFGMLLDDMAGLVFGVGVLIFVAGWLTV